MLSPEENSALADLLFPDVTDTREDAFSRYPKRPEGTVITRFAPSPTGFLHLGGVFMALLCERLAHQDGNGTFFLRIEDTDAKREVEGGVEQIVRGLAKFGIRID